MTRDQERPPSSSAVAAAAASSSSAPSAPPQDARGKVVASYTVYWNQPRSQRVMVLQFPNRDRTQPYNAASGQCPSRLRIKPKSGLVEIDVPLQVHAGSFDRRRARKFGRALRESRLLRGQSGSSGGSFGLAGGFGMSNPAQARVKTEQQQNDDAMDLSGPDADEDISPEDFEDEVAKGLVMNKITLGGRIKRTRDGDPVYAIGVFKGDELHLTRVDAFCSLQPQFHHLDAVNELERATARSQRDGGGDAVPVPAAPVESEARAINMTFKSTNEDDEQLDMSEVGKTLRAMQEEPWQYLNWVDEDDTRAYMTYRDGLFLPEASKAPRLVSMLSAEQYLDAISAPRVEPSVLGQKVIPTRRMPEPDDDISDSTDADGSSDGAEVRTLQTSRKKRTLSR